MHKTADNTPIPALDLTARKFQGPRGQEQYTAPIICGGTYIRSNKDGSTEEAQMVASKILVSGKKVGIIRRYGYDEEYVIEGDPTFVGWTLMSVPTRLDEPIRGLIGMSDAELQKATIARLEAQLLRAKGVEKAK